MKEIDSTLLFEWAKDLFPLNRSLTGEGVRSTLNYLKKITPEIEIKEIPSGTKVFDWNIPEEWYVSEAYIEDLQGNRIVDFKVNNLHLVGYSTPIDAILTKSELEKNVYFLENKPDVIPYVTSYYEKSWGFCLTYNMWRQLPDASYHVVIRSKHFQGSLTYGEFYIQGKSSQEVLLSSYVCHPSMFSNELSGPIVLVALFEFLKTLASRHYSYRGLLLPETIGSIAYLSQNLQTMKRDVVAGWVLTCLADEGKFSYIPSRLGQSYADRITLSFAQKSGINLEHYTWLDRGSDERQYGAPGIDLPVCSVTRTKYGNYPEYHTSADNLSYGSKKGLFESFQFYRNLLLEVEKSRTPKAKVLGEPQMGKRNLYPTTSGGLGISRRIGNLSSRQLVDIVSYADGQHNIHEIAIKCNLSFEEVNLALKKLESEKIIGY